MRRLEYKYIVGAVFVFGLFMDLLDMTIVNVALSRGERVSVGFCYAVGFVANAAARGIEISSMEYEIEGDLDVRRFLGLDGVRPGFTEIRATGRVSSPNATKAQLEELCQYVQDTSPVRDSLANPVAVKTSLQVK